jgi:hypothetical protein
VFLKDFTDDGKGNNEESEDNESKDLLLKEIELMFENGYFYKTLQKCFHHFMWQISKELIFSTHKF